MVVVVIVVIVHVPSRSAVCESTRLVVSSLVVVYDALVSTIRLSSKRRPTPLIACVIVPTAKAHTSRRSLGCLGYVRGRVLLRHETLVWDPGHTSCRMA